MLGLTKISWSHGREVKIQAKGEGGKIKMVSGNKKEMDVAIEYVRQKNIKATRSVSEQHNVLTARKTAQLLY